MSTVVRLANPAPQMQVSVPVVGEDGEITIERRSAPAKHLSASVTVVSMRDDFADPDEVELALSTPNDRVLSAIARVLPPELRTYAIGVAEIESIMATHSAGEAPTWVACEEDEDFARAISLWVGCPIGEPQALLTSVGRDALHKQHLDTATQPAAFNYICVSANATAPSTASTTCPGEITTAGGGMLRAQGTFAHTTGTNTSTLTKTFTANGSDSLPVVLAKIGVLNASSSGTLGYETLLNATATLTVSGDNVTITETVTGG